MKRALTLLLALAMATALTAQKRSAQATRYKEFKPSVITLASGKQLKQPLTNVFLKNSSLLYMRGHLAMQANMDNVKAVDFDDCHFVNIERQLASLIDSVGTDALYCVELFDQETYEANLKNNVNLTSLDLRGDQMGTTTVDLNTDEDRQWPVFRHYYFLLDGQYVKVHERDLLRRLNDERRDLLRRLVAAPHFSWEQPESLLTLLRALHAAR